MKNPSPWKICKSNRSKLAYRGSGKGNEVTHVSDEQDVDGSRVEQRKHSQNVDRDDAHEHQREDEEGPGGGKGFDLARQREERHQRVWLESRLVVSR